MDMQGNNRGFLVSMKLERDVEANGYKVIESYYKEYTCIVW